MLRFGWYFLVNNSFDSYSLKGKDCNGDDIRNLNVSAINDYLFARLLRKRCSGGRKIESGSNQHSPLFFLSTSTRIYIKAS